MDNSSTVSNTQIPSTANVQSNVTSQSILGGIAGQYQNMQPGQVMQNTVNQNVNGIPNVYGTQTVTPSGVNVMSINNS